MNQKIELISNFENFKQDFKKETGLEANNNVEMYLTYYNGKCADISMQLLLKLLEKND